MVRSLPIHDLEGRDAQATADTGESADTTTIPQGRRGRILLSMMGSDGIVHSAAIVLPASYLEAKAMAIDFFHSQITSAGIPVQDLVLKLGMKLLSGEITWAPFRPEQWTDIVCNRDEIRLGGGGAEVVDLYVPGQLITLGLSHDYHFEQPRMSKYMTIVLPRTLEAIKIQKREKEYLN